MCPQIRVKTTEIYRKNRESKSRYVINVGGARSSKSYSIAQLFIEKLVNERGKKFLITRKTMPALRLTAYKLIIDLLKEYGLYEKCEHNKSENTLKINDNFLLFVSIDDPEKIKSSEWNYIWLEEANEFTWNDFIICKTRLSGKAGNERNQIFFSLNPNDELTWINQKLILGTAYAGKTDTILSSYKDNPFLDEDYIDDLEGLETEDPNYWRIYGLGLWGSLQNIIYQPYIVETEWPTEFDETIYGLDFGYNNPSSLLEIAFKDKEIWLTEKLYQTHLTNQQLIDRMKDEIPEDCRDRNIYGDSAEPARIEEISGAGFNIMPSDKSVKDGIDFCKRKVFHTRAENVNLNKERQCYKWKENKNGVILDDPVKFNDHFMDGKRYAVYTHCKSQGELNIRWV